jgi:hypothetical protein
MHSRQDMHVPVQNQERFRTIFFQSYFIEIIHGDLKYFSAHLSYDGAYCFSLDRHGYDKYILALKMVRPYSAGKLLQQVNEYLQKLFGREDQFLSSSGAGIVQKKRNYGMPKRC